jgi:hypothetical protein
MVSSVGNLKEKGFFEPPDVVWKRRLRHVPTSLIHLPKYPHLVVHVPGDTHLRDQSIKCSCYLALNLKMAHQKVIRDETSETSTKRASDGLQTAFCSARFKLIYLIWTGYAIAVSAMIDLPSGIPLWICMRTCLSERVLISTLPFAFPRISGIVCLYPGYLIRQ